MNCTLIVTSHGIALETADVAMMGRRSEQTTLYRGLETRIKAEHSPKPMDIAGRSDTVDSCNAIWLGGDRIGGVGT